MVTILAKWLTVGALVALCAATSAAAATVSRSVPANVVFDTVYSESFSRPRNAATSLSFEQDSELTMFVRADAGPSVNILPLGVLNRGALQFTAAEGGFIRFDLFDAVNLFEIDVAAGSNGVANFIATLQRVFAPPPSPVFEVVDISLPLDLNSGDYFLRLTLFSETPFNAVRLDTQDLLPGLISSASFDNLRTAVVIPELPTGGPLTPVPTPVPLPAAGAMLLGALAVLGVVGRRRLRDA